MENTKITAGTIARTIILLVALANQLLTATGHSVLPFDDENITACVTTIFTIVTAIIAWWKNNSFTKEAISADNVMKEAKANKGA